MSAAFKISIDSRARPPRAPHRLGLTGGSTDISAHRLYSGAVLKITSNMHAYVCRRKSGEAEGLRGSIHVHWREVDVCGCGKASARHALHQGIHARVAQKFFNSETTLLEIQSTVNALAGSGPGLSLASFAALLEAFRHRFKLPLGRHEIADLTREKERQDLSGVWPAGIKRCFVPTSEIEATNAQC